MRSPCTTTKSSPLSPQLEKDCAQQRRPNTAIHIYINKKECKQTRIALKKKKKESVRIPGHLEVSALPLCWWNTGTTWEPVRNADSQCPQTHRMRICISPRSPGDWSIYCNLRNAALICLSKSFRPVDSQPQLHSRIMVVGRQELLKNTPRMPLQWSWGCLCTDSFRHCPVFLGARVEALA